MNRRGAKSKFLSIFVKMCVKKLFLLPALMAGLAITPGLKAQTFRNLHNFAYAGSDGSQPYAGLILSGNTLYGTATEGVIENSGTVFRINTDGTGFTNVYNFTALPLYPALVVTHDQRSLDVFDRTLEMEDGRVRPSQETSVGI
jgi:hypothetical protein